MKSNIRISFEDFHEGNLGCLHLVKEVYVSFTRIVPLSNLLRE